MKKNIIIAVLIVLCVVMTIYAQVQSTLAAKFQGLAVKATTLARAEALRADQQARLAEANTIAAQEDCRKTLQKCRESKK